MANTGDRRSEASAEASATPPDVVPMVTTDGPAAAPGDHEAHPDPGPAPTTGPPGTPPRPSAAPPASHPWRKRLLLIGALLGLTAAGYFLLPWVETMMNTVSTDDAYVNGH